MSQFKDDLILSKIMVLSKKVQNNERVWRNARIIEWLTDIIRSDNTYLANLFMKWLDNDEEREMYSSIIFK